MEKHLPFKQPFAVDAVWDDNAEVWVAECDGVPGLIAEADSRSELKSKLAILIPELLELNVPSFNLKQPIDVSIAFRRKADRHEERMRIPKAA